MPRELASDALHASRALEWRARLSIFVGGLLGFEIISGLWIWLLPFGVPSQYLVLLHTAAGILCLAPYLIYQGRHWWLYRSRPWSHFMMTGYVAFAAIAVLLILALVRSSK